MLRNKRKILCLMSLILPLQFSAAQVLSVDECIQMALNDNKEIQSANWRVTQYQHTRQSLLANYFPKISINATDVYSTINGNYNVDIAHPVGQYVIGRVTELAPDFAKSEIGKWYLSTVEDRLTALNPNLKFKVGNFVTAMAQLEQPIYMGGKIRSAYKMGQIGEEMSVLGVGVTEEETVLKVYEAYSLVLKAKEMMSMAQKYDSLIVQVQRTVASAVTNGMARQADLIKVNSAKGKAELQIHQAKNGLKLAKMNLCQIIGLPLTTDIDVTRWEVTPASVRDEMQMADITSRKEYHILDMKTQLAEQKVKLQRSDFLPQIGLMVGGGILHGGSMLEQDVFNKHLHGTVALQVKIPIFHAGEGRHKVLAAKAEYEQARLEQETLNEKMQLQIQQAANEYDEAVLETSMNERIVDDAAESLRLSGKAYQHGMETITDLLTAQTEWQNANTEYIEAKHRQVIKEINWRKVTGQLNYNKE